MKKLVAVILIFAMSLGLCACGVSPEIEEKLKTNKWSYKSSALGVSYIQVYEFLDSGEYVNTFLTENGGFDENQGTYKIEKDKIVLVNKDGDEIIFNYQYTDGELSLSTSDGTQLYNVKS